MKLTTCVQQKVDVEDLLHNLDFEKALKLVKLTDTYQFDCDFTYEVARAMIKRLNKELGRGSDYAEKLMEIL